ncbi:hypothetical protein BP422_26915 [Brevibacillus formosus]|uniref:TniQ domain-containing protein n=1 Tax=Brevibacillus formosus TaxID=54913 RepID=A0A220MPD8_9BACL|nr:TniQ family protein [Brevibacillus formosus]ASJ56832.1 hypothetical protein BP422_26915 [Brevibacillus formosus]
MNARFTIRPKPIYGESLSSYLIRIGQLNQLTYIDISHLIKSDHRQRVHQRSSFKIDLFAQKFISSKKIDEVLNLDMSTWKSMTFSYLYEKFYDQAELEVSHELFFSGNMINTSTRSFCPKCLKEEKGVYKLLWQVKELNVCQKHSVPLRDTCPTCGKRQPYVFDSMANAECSYCRNKLYEKKDEHAQVSIEKQPTIYSDWEYLIDPNKKGVTVWYKDKRRSALISLFFLAQGEKFPFAREEIEALSADYKHSSLKYLKEKRDVKKSYRVTLPVILKVLRKKEKNVDYFFSLQVPIDYIQSVISEESRYEIGTCKAPWCISYESKRSMKRISKLFLKNDNKIFGAPYICIDCNVIYGRDRRSGLWGECGDIIELAWKKVRPMVNANFSGKSVCETLGISVFILTKCLGYLARHKLLLDDKKAKYTPSVIIQNPEDNFRRLMDLKGTAIYNASEFYGWNHKEYWYYYYDHNVQQLLHLNKENDSTDIASISESKETTPSTLKCNAEEREYLLALTNKYVQQQIENREVITNAEYSRHVGKGYKSMENRYPEIIKWLELKKQLVKELILKDELEKRQEKVIMVVKMLYFREMNMSLTNVAKYSGITRKYIRTHKILTEAIIKTRESLTVQ